eukprot:scaffold5585_cov57-Attheya_sp.AAC.11
MDDGTVDVDYTSPAAAHLWNTIAAPIINLMSGKMKQFLGIFGVDDTMISPFCKTFENVNELRTVFLLYCPPSLQQQQNGEHTDTGEQLNEETIEEEMPNIQTVKSLITKVQNNMENAVNDDEVEETGEHDTDDLNDSENDIPIL